MTPAGRELEYHEKLYSGFAQQHFAKPAVRALREHIVGRILSLTGAGPRSRVLSLGCGIGDTELLLAPHVREVVGVELSPAGVRQAGDDAARLGISNVRFKPGSWEQVSYETSMADAIVAVFFMHHVPTGELTRLPERLRAALAPGGVFYSLDPSRRRLSGAVGRLLIPGLMKKYRSPDERELDPEATARLFRAAGFQARVEMHDFGSSPLAGLFPGWGLGYRMARAADDAILRVPALARFGSNFEIVARVTG
jgi:cyclopropane fatty-acyl-phospholipid synthase-like methyltransferase